MENIFIAVLILALPGVFLVSYGISLLIGKNKILFMTDHIYSGRAYMGIPGGLTFLSWFIAGVVQLEMLTYLGVVFSIISLLVAFIQPSFLKPAWLKWLEREHREIMPLLRQEVKTMGYKTWNKQMKTQADMEKWVAEVRAKHEL